MTVEHNEFERFICSKGGDTNLLELYNPFAEECFIAGFQAGRAHDVDGLIAEIKTGVTDKTLSTLAANGALYVDVIELFDRIRKHFGKE